MGVGTRQVHRTVTWRTGWGIWMFAHPAVPLPALASPPLVTFMLQSSSAGPGESWPPGPMVATPPLEEDRWGSQVRYVEGSLGR